MHHGRSLWAALALLVAIGCAAPSLAADYFGRPTNPTESQAAPRPPVALPAPLARALGIAVAWQSRLNAALRVELRQTRDGASLRPALLILALSFAYGVVHAIGPGHGKVVVASYVLSRRSRLVHGLAMSGVAALVQALSAILLVGFVAGVLDVSTLALLDRAAALEMASYAAIALLGLWMAWRVVRDHRHYDRGGDDGHWPADRAWRRMLLTGALVGLRPCSGAILVLLFSLANHILGVGVLATFAIALGVTLTVSLVSATALGIRRGATAFGGRLVPWAASGYRAAALGGALVIMLFGLLELAAVWAGALTPGAG